MRGASRKKSDKKKEEADTVAPPIPLLDIKSLTSGNQELNMPYSFEVGAPVDSINPALWRMEIKVDTLWRPVEGLALTQDSAMIRRYNVEVPWQAGERYRFILDSLAVTSIYGVWNKDFKAEFTVKTPEDYGNVIFDITDLSQAGDSVRLMVELLDKQDKPVQTLPLQPDGSVTFTYLAPSTFYARAYIDRNGNGQWDTGSIAGSVQPEDVFYYPKKLTLRKNWDINQEWALFGLPVDEQKPLDIKKNKPKNRDRNQSTSDEDEEMEDEYGDGYDGYGGFGGQDSWGNGSQYLSLIHI